jgi:signal transduction histidine kinase
MIELKDAQVNAETALQVAYAEALERFLSDPCEGTLRGGYEVGRKAIADGVGILEMASIHHAAMAKFLVNTSDTAHFRQYVQHAEEFFAESLSSHEMAHRGYQEALGALRAVNETLEREIQRIAHALHDEAGQLLVAAEIALAELAADMSPDVRKRLQGINVLLDQAEQQLRRISHELRPMILDDLGLLPAVQFLSEGISKRSKLSIHVQSNIQERFAPAVETAFYRIIQEGLSNISRHAQANNVCIQFSRVERNLCCLIQDDGRGFDVKEQEGRRGQKGLGLIGMRERLNALGGTLQVRSEPERGTSLLVTIPVEVEDADSRIAS